MGEGPIIARHGPTTAIHVRTGGAFGRRWCVVALVDVWGVAGGAAVSVADAVSAALVEAAIPGPSRSLSAALRAGLIAADRQVRRSAGGNPLLGAGASVLAWDGRAVLLAQCGPSLAYVQSAGSAEPEQVPPDSPWLRAERPERDDLEAWPALGWPPGQQAEPDIHWSALACAPGLRIVLAAPRAAEQLPREVLGALMALPPERGANGLAAALPEATPAVWFGLPRARTTVGSTATGAAQGAAPDAAAVELPIGATVGPRAAAATRAAAAARAAAARMADASGPWLRGLAASAVRTADALLPSRPPEHARDERALAAAAGALLVPLAAVALAGVMHVRLGGDATAPTPPAVDALDGAIDPSVPGSPPVRRLAGLEVAAPLSGRQGDARVLVVAPDARYVLNRAQGAVERISPEAVTPRLVLGLGQEIAGETVAALEDLAWLPHADGSGRVVALDAAGRLWQVDGSPRPIALSPPAALASPARLAGQDGLVYVLDRAGAIARYRLPDADAGTASEGAPWVQGLDLSGAVDVVVDGAVYVLFADGRIARFQDGVDTGLAITGLDPALSEPSGLFAAPALGRLLVADAGNGRIVDLSTGGSARARLLTMAVAGAQAGTSLADGRLDDLHAVWWQADEGVLWVVAGAFLFRAPFDPRG